MKKEAVDASSKFLKRKMEGSNETRQFLIKMYRDYKCKHLPEKMNVEDWLTGLAGRSYPSDEITFVKYYVSGVTPPIKVTYQRRGRTRVVSAGGETLELQNVTCGCVNDALRMLLDQAIERVQEKTEDNPDPFDMAEEISKHLK